MKRLNASFVLALAALSAQAYEWPSVIYDDDGCDMGALYPTELAITPENFYSIRLANLPGTMVDAVAYCPGVTGFFQLLKAGERCARDFNDLSGRFNAFGKFAEKGMDGLGLAARFCRDKRLGIIASLRMNDTHDSYTPRLFSDWKRNHPECLFSSKERPTRFCSWSALDYSRPEVRAYTLGYVREIVENYDVDGVLYDFCRHSQLFRSVADGGTASADELALMNGLVRDLRKMTREVAGRRGRELVTIIRTPDSAAYCKAIGMDIESWLSEGLLDAWIGSSYFHLEPWADSVALAHRHGVKFFAAMDESRMTADNIGRSYTVDPKIIDGRIGEASYMARFSAAAAAGCDGLHVFNFDDLFNATPDVLRRIMNADFRNLGKVDRLYFAYVRGVGGESPSKYLNGGNEYQKLARFNPAEPASLAVGREYRFPLELGYEFSPDKLAEACPKVEARMLTSFTHFRPMVLRFNGRAASDAGFKDGVMTFRKVDPVCLKPGLNEVSVMVGAESSVGTLLHDFALSVKYGE